MIALVSHAAEPRIALQSSEIASRREASAKGELKLEKDAQRYEASIIQLWDDLRESGNSLEVFSKIPFIEMELPDFELEAKLPERVFVYTHRRKLGRPVMVDRAAALSMLDTFRSKSFEIDHTEWRMTGFAIEEGVAYSSIEFKFHVRGPEHTLYRRALGGSANIEWQTEPDEDDFYLPKAIIFNDLFMVRRSGTPLFEEREWLESPKGQSPYSTVLIEDLNDDGLPDVVFPMGNDAYINKGGFRFENTQLFKHFPKKRFTGVAFIDIDVDGSPELVQTMLDGEVVAHFRNKKTGLYDGKPKLLFKNKAGINARALSAGDLDGDNLPEIFIGQYRTPYVLGDFPNPYFNANDGFPALLLRNEGGSRFSDRTDSFGLGPKSKRRTNTASISDLNGDGVQDLFVLSDFSGIDLYRGSGDGKLEDVSGSLLDSRSLFGASHVYGDFDRDGNADIFAVGRDSHIGSRLDQLEIKREGYEELDEARGKMAFGSRLYFGDGAGSFEERPLSRQVATAGYGFGSAAIDFNNDGYDDLAVGNGNFSGKSALDYDVIFWSGDVYDGVASLPFALAQYFNAQGPRAAIFDGEASWAPYQANRLYLNLLAQGFLDVSYLAGISRDGDARPLLSEDFNGDGKLDLLLVENDVIDGNQRVVLFENRHPSANHWIGIRLSNAPGKSIYGTRVRLKTESYTTEKRYVLGNGYLSQSSSTLNFGLGEQTEILEIEVIWPDGSRKKIERPDIDRYLDVAP